MKKVKVLLVALMAVVAFSVSSCMIMDWIPVTIRAYVVDGNGTDLLNPENENNVLDGVSLTYRDDVYFLTQKTKELPLEFHGFELFTDAEGKYYLYFGELDGADEYDDDFIITWKSGAQDIIHYKRNIVFNNANEKLFLNGKKVAKDDVPVTIVK